MRYWEANLLGAILGLAEARQRLHAEGSIEDFNADLDYLEDFYDPNQAQFADLRAQLGFDEAQSLLLEATLAKTGEVVSHWSRRNRSGSQEWLREMVESVDWIPVEALASALIRLCEKTDE